MVRRLGRHEGNEVIDYTESSGSSVHAHILSNHNEDRNGLDSEHVQDNGRYVTSIMNRAVHWSQPGLNLSPIMLVPEFPSIGV